MMTYRESVQPGDADAVREIVTSTGFFWDDEIEIAVELVEERLTNGDDSGYYFIFAEENGEVIGYSCFGPIACTRSSFDLYWIAVRESQRGKGLGKDLLARTERRIQEMGGTRIYVETSSREQYDPTRHFYEKTGYEKDAVIKDFYAPGDHKVLYVKVV
jgi:ribosomal protein S18 acetylase RimI-like enzyme